MVEDPAESILWSDANVTTGVTDPAVDCGPMEFEIVNIDGSSIDTNVFTANLDPSLGAIQELSVYSILNSLAGTYDLKVKAWFTNYATNVGEKDFSVVVQENCETAMVVTPSAPIANESFTVARVAVITGVFAEFAAAPAHCFISGYTYTVTPALTAPDDLMI